MTSLAMSQVAPLLWLLLAVSLEIAGTTLLKLSDGLSKRLIGLAGIALVVGAFAALAHAVVGMELSVAYVVWGGVGLVVTAVVGACAFGQKVRPSGWAGIVLVVAGMAAFKLL